MRINLITWNVLLPLHFCEASGDILHMLKIVVAAEDLRIMVAHHLCIVLTKSLQS